jgi:periplasmic protein TonB
LVSDLNAVLTLNSDVMETKKSSSADLESRKSIFFKTGLILSLVTVLMAFQYQSYERTIFVSDGNISDDIFIEEIPITKPKPPDPPPPPKSMEIVPVPDDQVVEDNNNLPDIEANENTVVAAIDFDKFTKAEVEIVEDVIFERPEIMPEFPGGVSALFEYLGRRIKYPSTAKELNIHGTVFLSFVIEKDGSVTNVELVRGISGGCDEEAIRVVAGMPNWIPGRMGTQPVRVKFSLPVRFKLE